MTPSLKARLFAVGLIVVSAGLIAFDWYRLAHEHRYSIKIAAFCPLGIVFGIATLFNPALLGKPETAREKTIGFSLFAVGILAGLVNWYLMDPVLFGFLGLR